VLRCCVFGSTTNSSIGPTTIKETASFDFSQPLPAVQLSGIAGAEKLVQAAAKDAAVPVRVSIL
jgi:hypothetical protein